MTFTFAVIPVLLGALCIGLAAAFPGLPRLTLAPLGVLLTVLPIALMTAQGAGI
jgi:hypothetical protein